VRQADEYLYATRRDGGEAGDELMLGEAGASGDAAIATDTAAPAPRGTRGNASSKAWS
jgi:hypothetical protein